MKMSGTVSKILTNKYVLYLVAILALINVIGFLMMGKLPAVILFALIGYLMSHFSKNMMIVLLVPLIVVNLFMSGKAMKEGMKGEKDEETEEKKKDNGPAVMPGTDDHPASEPDAGESFEVGRKNARTRVDYGSTLEQAYDDLSGVLGGDGIKRLTGDTQKLMKQQLQLAEAMKDMGPLLQQAQGMLKSLNVNELGDLGSIVKQLGGGLGGAKPAVPLIQKE